jgi:hypothetical protein
MSNVIAVPIVDFDDKSYVSVQSLSHSSWARLKQVDFALTDPDRKTFAGQKVWVDMDTKTIVGPQHGTPLSLSPIQMLIDTVFLQKLQKPC